MGRCRLFLILGSFVSQIVIAQEIAIFDQGYNTLKTNNGLFYNPVCIGAGNQIFTDADYTSPTTIFQGTKVVITQASLCDTSPYSSGYSATNANVPKSWSFNDLNANNQPFEEVAMAVLPQADSPRTYYFSAPFKNLKFGANLTHGTHVANAAYEFDSAVKRKMVQVYHIDGVRSNSTCIATPTTTISPNTATTGGTTNILSALQEIINNPDGVDAINMSIVFRQPCYLREQNQLVPPQCTNNIGQDEVYDLAALGIPLVVGLNNYDIETNEKTWPACLNGVIKVGAQNDNNNITNGGIGIGANDIDFYARNTVSANGGTAVGNSLAAPRIATAYALLKTAVPNSTIEQRTEALNLADSRMNTYKGGHTRRYVRNIDIPDAITELQELIDGNIDNIFFEDPNEYGSIYAGNATSYSFEIDFDQLIGSNPASAFSATSLTSNFTSTTSALLASAPNARDVVISFNTKMSNNLSLKNGIKLYINNILRASTGWHNGTASFSYTLNRNVFSTGKNTIRLESDLDQFSRPWGINNIKADFHPVIPLTVGQTNNNNYGYSYTPARYTGLRTSFMVDNLDSDYVLSATGWDIDLANENEVFINDTSLGYLTQGTSSAYAPKSTFVLRKEELELGQNVVEFVQRYPGGSWSGFEDEKWAVKDILIESAPPDLTVSELGIVDKSLKANVPFGVSVSVRNDGSGYSDDTFLQFYVSSDENISTSDTLILSESFSELAPNRTRVVNTNIQSSQVNEGFFLGACVVVLSNETNAANNCSDGIPLKNNINVAPIIMLLLDD